MEQPQFRAAFMAAGNVYFLTVIVCPDILNISPGSVGRMCNEGLAGQKKMSVRGSIAHDTM